MTAELADSIGNDTVPEAYRGFFDNADWTLHKLVVQGSWVFLVIAAIIHFAYLNFYK
jgi:hypothetical protein